MRVVQKDIFMQGTLQKQNVAISPPHYRSAEWQTLSAQKMLNEYCTVSNQYFDCECERL